jgi:hypothetical protein
LLVAVQIALIAVLHQRAPDVTRAWRPFPITGLRDGVRVSQTFDIGYHGLQGIDLSAEMAAAPTARFVDVRVAGPDGGDRVSRKTTVVIPAGQTTCCRIAFDRIPTSGRRFHLDLTFRGFDRAAPLTLEARTVRVMGGLRINDRALPANLAMRPDGDIDGVPGAMRISLVGFAAALLAIDALVALAVYRMLSTTFFTPSTGRASATSR